MKRKIAPHPLPSNSKIARFGSPESEDVSGTESDSSQDSEGSDVSSGSPRKAWPEFAKEEAIKIVNQKPNSTIYCPVCQRHGRAGATADMKGFIRHCETKPEHAKQHKGFLKYLKEAKGGAGGSLVVVHAEKSHPKMMTNWENQGKVVTPFILIIHNFDVSENASCNDVSSQMRDEKDVLLPLSSEILDMTSCEPERVDSFPEKDEGHSSSWRYPTCFAVFKNYQDLVMADEFMKARGWGIEGWKSFLSSEDRSINLFGYRAGPQDMELLDPERKKVDWKVENHFDVVSKREDVLREANESLKEETRRQQLLAEKAHAQRHKFAAATEQLVDLWESEKSLLEQEESRVRQSFTVLRCEKDGFDKKIKEKEELLKAAYASKLMEMINIGSSDEEAALESLMAARAGFQSVKDALREMNEKHQDSVSESIRMKRESEKVIVQTAEIEKEIKNCDKMEKTREAVIKELERRTQNLKTEVETIHKGTDGSLTPLPSLDASDVALFGIDCEKLKNLSKQSCKRCGKILGLPPSNEDVKNKKPGIERALQRCRALLAPCGCITFCKECADKMRICPTCKTKIIEKGPLTLFGYCNLG